MVIQYIEIKKDVNSIKFIIDYDASLYHEY